MNKEYTFYGYGNFCIFCKVNYDYLFIDEDNDTTQVIKDQVDLLLKAFENTKGGCPCNKRKRRETVWKVYKESVEILSKSPIATDRICELLNNPDEVIFLEGVISGNPSPNRQIPFLKIDNKKE